MFDCGMHMGYDDERRSVATSEAFWPLYHFDSYSLCSRLVFAFTWFMNTVFVSCSLRVGQ